MSFIDNAWYNPGIGGGGYIAPTKGQLVTFTLTGSNYGTTNLTQYVHCLRV
jgi:hypothetical protein